VKSGRLVIALGAFLVVAAAVYLVFGRGREIQGADARRMVAAGARLVDVRSAGEFANGHLPGAVNIPVQELDRRLAEVGPRDGELILYCRSGSRSGRAAALLRANGFTKVHNLGPMTAW
jgi:rhodanese-related sulfurtransferase